MTSCKTVKVRNVMIGEGAPKICVPIVEKTRSSILEEVKAMGSIPLDLVEWRVDFFEDVFNFNEVQRVLIELRKILQDIPLLFTFRTAQEGGEQEISLPVYEALNLVAVESGCTDLIDVEMFSGKDTVKSILRKAQQAGVKVIASNHNFEKTPTKEEMLETLRKMQEIGADIAKIAVMPSCKKDVLTLFEATLEMQEGNGDTPIITMSMSEEGMVSRLVGGCFGSAVTFGAMKKTSAPGQIGAEALSQVLQIIHKNHRSG